MTKVPQRRLVRSEREIRLLNRNSRNKIVSDHLTNLVNNFRNLTISRSHNQNMAQATLQRHSAEYLSLKAKIDPLMATIDTLIGDDEEARYVKKNKTKVEAYAVKLLEIDDRLKDLLLSNPEILDNITKVREEVFDLGLDARCCIQEAEDFISKKTLGIIPGSLLGPANNPNLVKLEAMKLQHFAGNIKEYNKWKQITRELVPVSMTDGVKIARVTSVLEGEASDYVGKIGKHLESWDAFWSYLDDKYSDEWANSFEIIGEMVAIKPNQIDDRALTDLGNKFGQILQAILATKMDAEQIMTTWFFHLIPTEIRRQMLNTLKTRTPDVKSYRWTQINRVWNEQVSVLPKEDTSEAILNTLTYKANVTHSQSLDKNNHQSHHKTQTQYKSKFKQHSIPYCAFCQETGHKIYECTKYVTKEEQDSALKKNKMCLICARKNERGVHECIGYCKCGCSKTRWRCDTKKMKH